MTPLGKLIQPDPDVATADDPAPTRQRNRTIDELKRSKESSRLPDRMVH